MTEERAARIIDATDSADATTVRRARFSRPGPSVFELTVIEGPDAGLALTLDGATSYSTLVGSSAMCGIRLGDARALPRHCSFELNGGRLRLVNLGGVGATRVNGVATSEAYLVGGEVVRVGETVFAVKRGARRESGPRETSFGRLRGESAAMSALYPLLAELVRGTWPVLVEGERGTGKRLVAEELHRLGITDARSFVVLDRGTAAEALHEALFGAGGVLEDASVGVVYVEEAADLDPATQARLADHFTKPLHGGPRVVLATRGERPLECALSSSFGPRTQVKLPPLRAREGDVIVLARHLWSLLGATGGLPDDFAARFEGHPWPGNVRELRIAVQDRILHGDDDDAESGIRPVRLRGAATEDALGRVIESGLTFVRARDAVLAEFERRYVARALERGGGNVARAAAASGIAHRYFQVLKSRQRARQPARPKGV